MKISSDLEKLFQELVPVGPHITRRKMFGYLCAFVNGNLFAGISQQNLMFRLPPAEHADFLRQPGTRPLEPRPGLFSKRYAVFQDPFAVADDVLAKWMERSFEFASRMPEK